MRQSWTSLRRDLLRSEPARGYDSLYRRLTRQPLYMKPTLGPVRQLPRQNEFSAPFTGTRPRLDALVLLKIPDVGAIAVPALEITRDATLKLVLAPTDAESAEQLSMLRNLRSQAIGIAYNLTATRARVKSDRDVVRAGVEQIELELIEEEPPSELGTEMSYNNIQRMS